MLDLSIKWKKVKILPMKERKAVSKCTATEVVVYKKRLRH